MGSASGCRRSRECCSSRTRSGARLWRSWTRPRSRRSGQAAATAVAARYLARQDAAVVTVCGCGTQGRAQLRALAVVRRLTRAYAVDRDATRAAVFAREMSKTLGFEVSAQDDLDAAARVSDICVTCTPSRTPILGRSALTPGTFVAAVGADNEVKQELEPALMAAAAVVVDVLEQAVTIGDLHHAIAAGAVTADDVRAELGQVIAGLRPGRLSDDEIYLRQHRHGARRRGRRRRRVRARDP